MDWSASYSDTSIPNIRDKATALQDFNGKTNSAKAGGSAAIYAQKYVTEGTQRGEWYLPALGELNTAYQNKDFLNYALTLLGEETIKTDDYYWSSTEYSDDSAWSLNFKNGNTGAPDKSREYYIHSVLAF